MLFWRDYSPEWQKGIRYLQEWEDGGEIPVEYFTRFVIFAVRRDFQKGPTVPLNLFRSPNRTVVPAEATAKEVFLYICSAGGATVSFLSWAPRSFITLRHTSWTVVPTGHCKIILEWYAGFTVPTSAIQGLFILAHYTSSMK